MADRSSPRARFNAHKSSATQRGIAFLLSFEQWWELWEPFWEKRGKGAQDMCMCRTADKGAYEWGNVRIATVKENQHERSLERRTTRAQRRYKYRARYDATSYPADSVDWATGRNAFAEYKEDE